MNTGEDIDKFLRIVANEFGCSTQFAADIITAWCKYLDMRQNDTVPAVVIPLPERVDGFIRADTPLALPQYYQDRIAAHLLPIITRAEKALSVASEFNLRKITVEDARTSILLRNK